MEGSTLQILLAVAMFLTTAIAGFVPIKLVRALGKKEDKSGKYISWLSCFSGGVFMATCFLDIIPHINENYERFITENGSEPSIPLPQLFTCIGFFLVYLIEETCLRIFSMPHMGHSHDEENTAPPQPPIENHRKESIHLRKEPLLLTNDEKLDDKDNHLHGMVIEETANYAVADEKDTTFLKSVTFAIAMSFHSILEGFALGVQDTTARIVTLFISLILHKGIEAFSVGLQICKGNANKTKQVVFTILVYALMTPLGSGLGTLLQMSEISPLKKDGAVLILESLAAGTFIYVTFLEVLAHEKSNSYNSLKQLLCIFIGFATIALLQFVFGGHGGHEEGGHSHVHIEPEATTVLAGLTRL